MSNPDFARQTKCFYNMERIPHLGLSDLLQAMDSSESKMLMWATAHLRKSNAECVGRPKRTLPTLFGNVMPSAKGGLKFSTFWSGIQKWNGPLVR